MSRFFSQIPGVSLRRLQGFADERGLFRETFRQSWFPGASGFVQSNVSASRPNVLRGLHYHLAQDDFWVVVHGRVTAALADIRAPARARAAAATATTTGRRWVDTFALTAGDGIYIPRGVAHGFYAHDDVLLVYHVTAYYDGKDEHGIAWDDPDLAVPWPCHEPILSPRDRQNPRLSAVDPALLPP